MQQQIVQLICDRLRSQVNLLRDQFTTSSQEVGVRYALLDDLLPESISQNIQNSFPTVDAMCLIDSFREKKYTSKSFDKFDLLMEHIMFPFQEYSGSAK